MGSSGSSRKGRRHLPKAGTRPDLERELHERREEALHPFATDPWQRRSGLARAAPIVVVVLVLLAILGLILLL